MEKAKLTMKSSEIDHHRQSFSDGSSSFDQRPSCMRANRERKREGEIIARNPPPSTALACMVFVEAPHHYFIFTIFFSFFSF